jgi:hypothetical protein
MKIYSISYEGVGQSVTKVVVVAFQASKSGRVWNFGLDCILYILDSSLIQETIHRFQRYICRFEKDLK